jgi:hypothetical protein
MNVRLNTRFDAILAHADQAGRPALGTYGEHFLTNVVLRGDGVKLDDDEAYILSRALETTWATQIESPRAPLPLAEGELLPDSPAVEEGSTVYRYILINDQGHAAWSSSMSGHTMPMVSLTAAEMTGHIQTMEGGYMVSRKQLRQANKGNVRLVPRSNTASVRAHMELWDETLAWGEESLNLLGLFNHPMVSVTTASLKAGPANTFWRGATIDEIVADVAALVNSIPRQTNELMHANRVLMSPRLYDYCQQTRVGGDNGSLTILQHLVRIFQTGADGVVAPANPVQFGIVRYLDATNARSRGEIASDSLFAYIDNDPEVVARVRGFIARAYPTQEDGTMMITPMESEVGAIEMAQPLCCVRMDGVFNG